MVELTARGGDLRRAPSQDLDAPDLHAQSEGGSLLDPVKAGHRRGR
jgi:hypothetical protein